MYTEMLNPLGLWKLQGGREDFCTITEPQRDITQNGKEDLKCI
jgi:hypothetical protein